jgi:L-threonylcarbamoyladenylate synthase
MRYWHVNQASADGLWAVEAAARLREGAVIACPTDTLYGLAADPRLSLAIERLYRIKGRAVDQAIPLIAASLGQLETCGAVLTPAARRLADAFWPGPLTIVVAAWPGLCPEALAGGATVAVRVPDHAAAIALAAALGHPVTSTSANRSGDPPTTDPAVVAAALGGGLDGLVDAGPCPGGPPSTIVDVSSDTPRLVRTGAVAWERVLESLR